jgi:hypothetical protein
MIIEAIAKAGIQGKSIQDSRQKIRDYLANLTHIDNAIEG